MLLNISYNEPKVKEKIETLVGKPFTLKREIGNEWCGLL